MKSAQGVAVAVLLGAVGAIVASGVAAQTLPATESRTDRVLAGNTLPPETVPAGATLLASAPDFAVTVTGGAVASAPGFSGATVVSTTISGGFDAAITLSTSGLPAGVTATFAPATIAAPGEGSATLTLAVGAAVATGSYTVTVSGTGSSTTRSVSLPLTFAPLVPTPQTIFTDSFDGAFPGPWSVYAFGTSATWGTSSYRPYSGADSVYCAATGSQAAPAGGPYKAGMNSWMIYGPFSLVGATAAHATFKYWIKTQTTNDTFQFMESTDGVHYWGFKKSGSPSGWQSGDLDFDDALLPSSALGHPQVYFAFIFASDASTQLEGAYADALSITRTINAATCAVSCDAAVPPSATAGAATRLDGTINATSCTGTPAFAWSFGDGSPAGSGPSPTHSWTGTGPFGWQMTASMGGQNCVKSGTVTVSPPPCTLSCGATVPEAASTRAPVAFHADAIASNCASAPAYAWTFGDGAGASTADAAHTYATMGPKAWTLTVTADTETCTDSGTVAIGQPVHRHLAQPH